MRVWSVATRPDGDSDLLQIVAIGDPVLRHPAEPVDPSVIVTTDFQRLIGRMRATMIAAPGVGLAAPQVGLGIRLAVIEDVAERWVDLDPMTLAERERSEERVAVEILSTVPGIDQPASRASVQVDNELVSICEHMTRQVLVNRRGLHLVHGAPRSRVPSSS